jgi:putative FmdB family regulatory protein
MPIYEYKCRECGKITEVLIKGSSPANTPECSFCKSTDLEKVFSVPALIKESVSSSGGETCCGSTARCDNPPCASGGSCCRE